jgi:hypothetical protein
MGGLGGTSFELLEMESGRMQLEFIKLDMDMDMDIIL